MYLVNIWSEDTEKDRDKFKAMYRCIQNRNKGQFLFTAIQQINHDATNTPARQSHFTLFQHIIQNYTSWLPRKEKRWKAEKIQAESSQKRLKCDSAGCLPTVKYNSH